MPRYAQLVLGPAGSGKSTYCSSMVKHGEVVRRTINVVNLDPAAEHFDYPVFADIRELIEIDDAMDDQALRFGPNGGLIFCMEYFERNLDWLQEQLGEDEDDYFLFDCPGQIELYTHVPIMRRLVNQLQNWNFRVCGVFLIDAQFCVEQSKFLSGMLTALSSMIQLEIPFIHVLSKVDVLSKRDKKRLKKFIDPDVYQLANCELSNKFLGRYSQLNKAIASVIYDYSLVKFYTLDMSKEDSITNLLTEIDLSIQYGEDFDVKEPKEIEANEQDEFHDEDDS
ncbi:unnamed protein product [Adineta steineri]|uniref:GPN-loop GTPase 3 n=1 Tax=Adineta steineri TaxID=433720 RepID=A0A815RLV0_9BILA|nr:unnamed protein product [Adineta steineri]CAF1417776.1 unnamed protein product [Adineta steineri]CAF1478814.1 unnamed protein product [Adineta steineri]CAF3755181.1 unnamed protein product [Adineta steineri]CAF3946190.1 unnamed protein product [Adineta steineri]